MVNFGAVPFFVSPLLFSKGFVAFYVSENKLAMMPVTCARKGPPGIEPIPAGYVRHLRPGCTPSLPDTEPIPGGVSAAVVLVKSL